MSNLELSVSDHALRVGLISSEKNIPQVTLLQEALKKPYQWKVDDINNLGYNSKTKQTKVSSSHVSLLEF